MGNSIPTSGSPLLDAGGSITPTWYRFFAESVPPKGALVLWRGDGTEFPTGYVAIATITVDDTSLPLYVLTKGTQGSPR